MALMAIGLVMLVASLALIRLSDYLRDSKQDAGIFDDEWEDL